MSLCSLENLRCCGVFSGRGVFFIVKIVVVEFLVVVKSALRLESLFLYSRRWLWSLIYFFFISIGVFV